MCAPLLRHLLLHALKMHRLCYERLPWALIHLRLQTSRSILLACGGKKVFCSLWPECLKAHSGTESGTCFLDMWVVQLLRWGRGRSLSQRDIFHNLFMNSLFLTVISLTSNATSRWDFWVFRILLDNSADCQEDNLCFSAAIRHVMIQCQHQQSLFL